jgi:hypothetical protein
VRKLAIFVEGHTELLFVDRLLTEIAGVNSILIEQRQIMGGASVPRTTAIIRAAKAVTNQKYYVLLIDCGGDHQVKTRILEEHEGLTNAGYSKIIGLRDVRPTFTHADIPLLSAQLRKYVKTSLIPVEIILAVMEIEAWFLAEVSHFPKIASSITIAAISNNLGFNPELDDMSLRLAPTEDISSAYLLGAQTYQKPARSTIENLDYLEMYVELSKKIPQLKSLVDGIDSFLV